jgi:thiol-disulfide isomerase/thioredoxin
MAEQDRIGKPARRQYFLLIGIAAVAGVLIGAVALLATGIPKGNDAVLAAADAACAGRVGAADVLDKAAVGQVAAMRAARPPSSVAALAFDGPDGKPMTIANLKGRTLLVNLWASWCGPCREEMPALDHLQAQMGGEKFQVVAINVDTGEAATPERFLSEVGVKSLPRYRDASMGVFNALKKKGLAFGLPVTMIVDGNGCELAAMNGPADWTSGDARQLIDIAMKENG